MTLARIDFGSSSPSLRRAGAVDIDADRAIVERVQAGDTAAFDLLYRQYFGRLRAFCLRRVGDAHDAEEIAQEAFAKAYAALPTLTGERRFYPWLSVIAARLCVDHHRREGRTEPTAEVAERAVEGGQDSVLVELDAAVLRLALARLPERQRKILRLRESEGWTYTRIAAHEGLSVGAVESLLVRARRRLRQEFVTLSGGERGLVGLPVLGGLWRRAAHLARRATSSPWSAEAAGMAAGAIGAMAVVVAIGLPGNAGPGPAPPARDAMTVVAHAEPAVAGLPDRQRQPAGLPAGDGAATNAGVPAVEVEIGGAHVVGPTTTSTADGRDGSEEELDVGPAWVGHSPGEIDEAVEEDLGAVRAWIGRKAS